MATIDDLIRDLARKGRINHITLTYSGDGRNHKFTAGYRDDRSPGYQMHTAGDPIDALMHVLKGTGYRHFPGNKSPDPLPGESKPKRSGRDLI